MNDEWKHYVLDEKHPTEMKVFSQPKRSDWECQIIGGPMGIVFVPTEGNEPNWFHRKMQELAFGFKWRKRK